MKLLFLCLAQHWQIPLSKRFRALKLWFVLRSFGTRGLQKHIREGVRLAQKFEALILADHRFEIPATRHLGMVVFRIKGENELTEKLLKRLNQRGHMHAVPASLKGRYVIRFTVTSTYTTNDDILSDWNEIRTVTTELLSDLNIQQVDKQRVSLKGEYWRSLKILTSVESFHTISFVHFISLVFHQELIL